MRTPCPLSNLRLCSLDRSHHKSPHPSRALAPLKSGSSLQCFQSLSLVWVIMLAKLLFMERQAYRSMLQLCPQVDNPQPALPKPRMPLTWLSCDSGLQLSSCQPHGEEAWCRQLFPRTSLLITRIHPPWGLLFNL